MDNKLSGENGTIMYQAVKYCGGCNPRFDRVQYVRNLESKLGQKLSSPVPGNHYDKVYVICGCTARCANVSGIDAEELVWIDPGSYLR